MNDGRTKIDIENAECVDGVKQDPQQSNPNEFLGLLFHFFSPLHSSVAPFFLQLLSFLFCFVADVSGEGRTNGVCLRVVGGSSSLSSFFFVRSHKTFAFQHFIFSLLRLFHSFVTASKKLHKLPSSLLDVQREGPRFRETMEKDKTSSFLFATGFGKYLEGGRFSDLVLQMEKKEYHVHRVSAVDFDQNQKLPRLLFFFFLLFQSFQFFF